MNQQTSLPIHQAIIKITNLRLRTYIGFNPDEMDKQQDVIINIEIHYPVGESFISDDVSHALNYKVITKKIIQHVEMGKFKLLERLTADVLQLCCEPAQVTFARVTIDKPHALRFADSVSLTLEFSR
ncbi:dihydroneopterin triphosphate 2'-epimerase [Shewanella sp. SNU WT4]|nr:dihydroneopterin triphosphate 2'-epimerase [Shewanella sp. SNU WT4]